MSGITKPIYTGFFYPFLQDIGLEFGEKLGWFQLWGMMPSSGLYILGEHEKFQIYLLSDRNSKSSVYLANKELSPLMDATTLHQNILMFLQLSHT